MQPTGSTLRSPKRHYSLREASQITIRLRTRPGLVCNIASRRGYTCLYLKHALMAREAACQKEDSYKAMREQAMDRAQLFYNSLYKRLLAIYPGMADYVEICFYDLPKLERSVKKSDPQMTLPDREQRYAEALRVAEALKTLDCEVDDMEVQGRHCASQL